MEALTFNIGYTSNWKQVTWEKVCRRNPVGELFCWCSKLYGKDSL